MSGQYCPYTLIFLCSIINMWKTKIKNCEYCGSEQICSKIVKWKDGTRHRKVYCGKCDRHLKFARYKRGVREIYQLRNAILSDLGFFSYQAYLLSKQWQNIRKKSLEKFDGKCFICSQKATEVHHSDYTIGNLSGKTIEDLWPVCRTCHERLEFDINGNRRNLDDVVRDLKWYIKRKSSVNKGYCCKCNKKIKKLKNRNQKYCITCRTKYSIGSQKHLKKKNRRSKKKKNSKNIHKDKSLTAFTRMYRNS